MRALRRRMARLPAGIAVVGLLAQSACVRAQVSYSVQDIGSLGMGGAYAYALNNNGVVVGATPTLVWNQMLPYEWANGQMTAVGNRYGTAYSVNDAGSIVGWTTPGGAYIYRSGQFSYLSGLQIPYAINNLNVVVGTTGRDAAMYDAAQQFHDLGTLGGIMSEARAINDAGQVAGWSYKSTPATIDAFLYTDGVMKDLGDIPGGNTSLALGINNEGDVVGWGNTPSQAHAFIYHNGVMRDLGNFPGWSESAANDINDLGQIVGSAADWSHSSLFTPHAVLWSGGEMLDINDLIPADSGWSLYSGTAINDRGQIIGYGMLNGQMRSFLLTPTSLGIGGTPEPGAITLLISGVLGWGAVCFRRRSAWRD